MTHIWLRDESRETERRAPLSPTGARALIDRRFQVTVEHSRKRVSLDDAYREAGCAMAPSGAWAGAPADAIVLGLKELPGTSEPFRHRHICFGHAYKGQKGWQAFLDRFRRGGGELLDIEYMTDDDGRRVAAFGYWAGYMGAALALIHWSSRRRDGASALDGGLAPFADAGDLDARIREVAGTGGAPRIVVVGALGRCGRGSIDLIRRHRCPVTAWDVEETRELDRRALIEHDILINDALILDRIPPFLTSRDLESGSRRLAVVSDVSCDPTSDINPLPFYDAPTTWDRPYLTVTPERGAPLDIIAIDNLPSLLPRESSEDFAEQLLPHLMRLDAVDTDGIWGRSRQAFREATARMNEKGEKP